MLDLAKIIETGAMIGADAPAYRALLAQIMLIVAPSDQETLKAAIPAAEALADEAHRKAQEL